MSDIGVLSTINDFIDNDKSSMPQNTLEKKNLENNLCRNNIIKRCNQRIF